MSAASLAQWHAKGRLIRGEWSRADEEGLMLLCLWTAYMGDPDSRPGDGSCPASRCPVWVQHLLPWLDDAGSLERWLGVVERVVALAPHLGRVTPECEWRVRALCVHEAILSCAARPRECGRVLRLCSWRGEPEPARRVSDAELRVAADDARARHRRVIRTNEFSIGWALATAGWAADEGEHCTIEAVQAAVAGAPRDFGVQPSRVAADRLADAILDEIARDVGFRVGAAPESAS